MSDTSSISIRLFTTPMRDLLRLRVTGRLAWRKAVRSADLPAEARALIEHVVGRTRLWRLEKAEVAEELLAHFAQGLACGATVNELVSAFGEPSTVARLIRRGKVRNRGILWQITRVARWFAIAILAVLAVLIFRYFNAHPRVSVDYFAELNRAALRSPADQRAWPTYEQAIKSMGKPGNIPWLRSEPGSPQDAKMIQWVSNHSDTIALIREASAKPVLGYILGPGSASSDPNADVIHLGGLTENQHLGLIGTRLPFLSQMRPMGNLLCYDMRVARDHQDGQRVFRDANALLDMAGQLRGPDQFPICNMVGFSIEEMALDQLDEALHRQPALLGDDQLVRLAHHVGGPQTAADVIDFHAYQLAVDDLAQRVFSDDGDGNGHITASGMQFLRVALPPLINQEARTLEQRATTSGPVPLVALTMASRREFLAMYNVLIRQASAEMAQPYRPVGEPIAEQALGDMRRSNWFQLRYGPLLQIVPGWEYFRGAAERMLGRRDGLLVGIALEMFHRRNGHYPATLSELSPLLLPTVPVDRFTGEALHYKLVAGKPLVYSVGADRVDDGGKPARSPGSQHPAANAAADFFDRTPPRGDWILYPQSDLSP